MQRLQQGRTLTRFRISEYSQQVPELLKECYKHEVTQRGRSFIDDEATNYAIRKVSWWLTDPSARAGLMLSGTPGNGKSTMARSIRSLIDIIAPSPQSFSNPRTRSVSALELADIVKEEDFDRMGALKRVECLFIDDVGCEAASVKVWGNEISPLVDLLYYRYDALRFTVITSNLERGQIYDRYGARIEDRFMEMFSWLDYNAPSYRRIR